MLQVYSSQLSTHIVCGIIVYAVGGYFDMFSQRRFFKTVCFNFDYLIGCRFCSTLEPWSNPQGLWGAGTWLEASWKALASFQRRPAAKETCL